MVGIDEKDVDWATFADLPCESRIAGVANDDFDVVERLKALNRIRVALNVNGDDFVGDPRCKMRSAAGPEVE